MAPRKEHLHAPEITEQFLHYAIRLWRSHDDFDRAAKDAGLHHRYAFVKQWDVFDNTRHKTLELTHRLNGLLSEHAARSLSEFAIH